MSPFGSATQVQSRAHSIPCLLLIIPAPAGRPNGPILHAPAPLGLGRPSGPVDPPPPALSGDLKSPTAARGPPLGRPGRAGPSAAGRCHAVQSPGRPAGAAAQVPRPGRRTNQCTHGFGERGTCERVLPCGRGARGPGAGLLGACAEPSGSA